MLALLAIILDGLTLSSNRAGSGEPVPETGSPVAGFFAADSWRLFACAGLALLPMALLGRMKVAGTANNFWLTDYFLSIAIALLFLRFCAGCGAEGRVRRRIETALLLLIVVMGLRTIVDLAVRARRIGQRKAVPSQQAYSHAKANPGTTYFPLHPLGPLLAEGRLYHTAWGVIQRENSGFPVTEQHFREGLPPNLERIAGTVGSLQAGSSGYSINDLLKRLPEFACRRSAPELPGWVVLERGLDACHAAGGRPR